MSLPTQPYKGARDFYPEEKRMQKFMFGKLRNAAELYGYEEYDAPILEPLDIYVAKSGEEIVNEQTYSFTDRGGRQVVIRPEMTPTVSRMVAGRRQELAYPVRWYSIPNLWRYERPQRGRLREHWQFNVDVFGIATIEAETELIQMVNTIFTSFGAKPAMYQIRLNHRALVDDMLAGYIGLSKASIQPVSKLIDRIHKMPRSEFLTKVDGCITADEKASGAAERLLTIMDVASLHDLPDQCKSSLGYAQLEQLLTALTLAGITNVLYDPTIMRGFDYYTGTIFEVNDTDTENNRSMMGGGRYDGLVGLFGVEPVATAGFGWGDVTLENFLRSHSLLPVLSSETKVYVAPVFDASDVHGEADVTKLCSDLRSGGISVARGVSGKKLTDHFKIADKKQIVHVLIVGKTELASNQYSLKNLATGKQDLLDVSGVIAQLS